jgi:hypothetical protein
MATQDGAESWSRQPIKYAETALKDEQNREEVGILSFQRGIIEASGYAPQSPVCLSSALERWLHMG